MDEKREERGKMMLQSGFGLGMGHGGGKCSFVAAKNR